MHNIYNSQYNEVAEIVNGANAVSVNAVLATIPRRRSEMLNIIAAEGVDLHMMTNCKLMFVFHDYDNSVISPKVTLPVNHHETESLRLWRVVAALENAFKYVIGLLQLNDTLEKYIYFPATTRTLYHLTYELDTVSRTMEVTYGYSLVDLVLSFANIHPTRPDLFYPSEIEYMRNF